jgi:phosphomannomutase/phosphoglucomutase
LKEKLNQDKDKLGIKSIIDVDGVRVIFEDGWGLVRASNTTPVIVTRFEAKTPESLDTIQNKLMNILKLKG